MTHASKTVRRAVPSWIALVLAVSAGPAAALEIPPDEAFVPLTCEGAPAGDPVRDAPGGADPRDIVGDAEHPAVLLYADASWLYLRMRLDESPVQQPDALRPFGWGFQFDVDGDLETYEFLSLVNGITEAVAWHANTDHAVPGDPTDPAEELLRSYEPAWAHWHASSAGSSFGGTPDHFLTWVVAMADLRAAGVPLTDPVVLWAGTSNSTQAINVDFVCHDGRQEARLPDLPLDPTPLDPTGRAGSGPADTDGDGVNDDDEVARGTDPFDADYRLVGSGCAAVDGSGPATSPILLALMGLALGARRPRRGRARQPASGRAPGTSRPNSNTSSWQ